LAEYKSSQLLHIRCNARESFHIVWTVELDNYDFEGHEEDEFTIEVERTPSANEELAVNPHGTESITNSTELMNNIIDKSLQIDLIKKKLNKQSKNELQIEVLFAPLRAFSGISKLHIINREGVRWTFQMNVTVNKAEVDDVIKIESQLHCTSSICFGLNLRSFQDEITEDIGDTPFHAYFTADSPFQFDVTPKTGVITGDEQQFIVSFTPNEYGAALNGKLIIETAIMEWSYRVIGSHPTYIPPNLNTFKPTVDDKISRKVRYERQKTKNIVKNKNFLKKNMAATRKSSNY